MGPIGPGNNHGYPWVQPVTRKVHYRSLYDQSRQYQSIRSILGEIGPFWPYLDYIGPKYVSLIGPVNILVSNLTLIRFID